MNTKPKLYAHADKTSEDGIFYLVIACETNIEASLKSWCGGFISTGDIHEDEISRMEDGEPVDIPIGERIGYYWVTTVWEHKVNELKKRPNVEWGYNPIQRLRNNWIPF